MFDSSTEQLAWSALGLFVLLGLLVLILQKSRSRNDDEGPTTSEMLTKFREIHAQGGLSDSEYRTIKRKLGQEMKQPADKPNDGDP